MRILAIADIDDLHWPHGGLTADVLLACGDVFDAVILEAAEACGCHVVFAVKGNHDRPARFPEPIVDLHLQAREYGGLTFGGFNGAWRYKPRGAFLHTEEEATAALERFVAVDVMLSHNSPADVHDRRDGVHYGFRALNAYIAKNRPKAVIHGHQHRHTESRVGETRVFGTYGYRIIGPGCVDGWIRDAHP